MQKYHNSAEYFGRLAEEAGAEIELTAHLFAENGYDRLAQAGQLQPGEQNPFIIGKEGIRKYFEGLSANAEARLQQDSK